MNTELSIKAIRLLGVVVLTMACALGTPVQPQTGDVGTIGQLDALIQS
jgi:hypothetical protein